MGRLLTFIRVLKNDCERPSAVVFQHPVRDALNHSFDVIPANAGIHQWFALHFRPAALAVGKSGARPNLDIGVEGAQDAKPWLNELDLIAVVRNLVDNAIRYTPNGGRIDLCVSVTKDKAVLRIQDNGPGIPLAERNRIFAPFYRTLGCRQPGSGLGLSIVQAVSQRIGAEIQLDFTDTPLKTGLSIAVTLPIGKD